VLVTGLSTSLLPLAQEMHLSSVAEANSPYATKELSVFGLPGRLYLLIRRNASVTISTAIAASNIVITSCCGKTAGGDTGEV